MKRARWRDRVGLPALLLTALMSTAVTQAALSAGHKPGVPALPDCGAVTPAGAARAALAESGAAARSVRVEPQIAKGGELTGRVLNAQAANGVAVSIVLPVESQVGKPTGDLVVYARHTAAAGSEVRAVDLATGCDVRLAAPLEIVRSALLDRPATALYVHSVARASRADAGVVRHDLQSGTVTAAMAPLSPADGFGPIFGTELHWSVDGAGLAVQSCGFSTCLTRVLDLASGKVTILDAPGQGAFIGLTSDQLVTFAACPGLPCDVLGSDLATGAVSTLAADALSAQLEPCGTSGAQLYVETAAGSVEVIQ